MSDKTKRVSYRIGKRREKRVHNKTHSAKRPLWRLRKTIPTAWKLFLGFADPFNRCEGMFEKSGKRVTNFLSAEGGREAKNFRCFVREKDSM